MAAAAAVPSRERALSLLRSLLRASSKFPDYNIREYARRRALDGFREKRALSDPATVAAALREAESQLEVARRQAVVYQLYEPKVKSVMEIKRTATG